MEMDCELTRTKRKSVLDKSTTGFEPNRTPTASAVCIASCNLPDYYSSAPKAEGPQDEPREPPAAP
jgi:hypothetical protein